MLLDERPLVLLPSLAQAVGVNEAVVIQQLHFHSANPDNGKIHNDKQWIYKTYSDWQATDFPFWSERTIQRTFLALEKRGLIVSCQPEGRESRRKYYRIDYQRLENFPRARAQEGAKSGASMMPKVALPLIRDDSTETTPKRTYVRDATPTGRRTPAKQPASRAEFLFLKDSENTGLNNLQGNSGNLDSKRKRGENFSSRNGAPKTSKPMHIAVRNKKINDLNARKQAIYRASPNGLTPEAEKELEKFNRILAKL